jgi:hypothetical protein
MTQERNTMHAEPQKEHQWLKQLVGEWTYEHECAPGPDLTPVKLTGTDTVRSLGGLWVLCEGKGEMPGGGIAQTLMTIGYDPAKKHYVGSFVASMMTFLWIYEGAFSKAMPSPSTRKDRASRPRARWRSIRTSSRSRALTIVRLARNTSARTANGSSS